MVDGELLFFFRSAFSRYAAPWRCSLWGAAGCCGSRPRRGGTFRCWLFVCFLFLVEECRDVCPVFVVDHSDMQGGGVVVRDDFDDPVCFQLLYEAVGSAHSQWKMALQLR